MVIVNLDYGIYFSLVYVFGFCCNFGYLFWIIFVLNKILVRSRLIYFNRCDSLVLWLHIAHT